ncbi:MAG: LacI family DNA-binding transcriptional regulator [Candidatus Onthomonas sp.]
MTIKDIARMAGVSVSTVSRVLNNHPDVSAPIRAQVLKVVEEQHFIPNSAARNLVRSQRNTVGVICRETGNPLYTPIIAAIEAELEALGWAICLRQAPGGEAALSYAAQLERAEKLKGIILLGGRGDYTAAMAAPLNVPFVCCTFTLPFGDLKPEQYSSVSIDDRAASYWAVEHLYSLGHREIAFLAPDVEDRSAGELRYQGYRQAQQNRGLSQRPEQLILCGSDELDRVYQTVRDLTQGGERFTALLALSDNLALAAIKAIHDSGLRVPEDCSVMSLDGLETTRYTLPAITTLVQPQGELGRQSVRILSEIIEEGGSHQHILLQPVFRAGESVAEARLG